MTLAHQGLSPLLTNRTGLLPIFTVNVVMSIQEVSTTAFNDQKPGTSGLRKRVKVFEQPNYTENFIQAMLDGMPEPGAKGSTFSLTSSENGKLMVGILLTASHNPGGPNADFGIKYNVSNGGPAPEGVTDKVYEITKTLKSYKMIELPEVDLSQLGPQNLGPISIEIVDSVADYLVLLKSIFDFDSIKAYLHGSPPPLKVLFDGMHGVTGPYGHAIFVETLGLSADSIQNCVSSPDFNGGHPDPNLTYAHELVSRVDKENIGFGAASDGDGDRNMIYGKDAFVTPSDSVAIIADWAQEAIPYFKSGVKGLARSMPTSGAIDLVAKAKNLEVFEVPTGWKFFGNLMDAGRLSICGEESFGTGSDHIREKDGLWAVVAWLSILAAAEKRGIKNGIKGVLRPLQEIRAKLLFTPNRQERLQRTRTVCQFADGSRIVYRLSGTGSAGATIRIYVEKYSKNEQEYEQDTQVGLKPLIEVALKLSKLQEFTGREKPTVIT
ncbi:hypothetical protein PSHT_13061 [Puccinia striiformis]|uniref:phosphoglucomutase (alpha-D-glucose-1,6-bisphosphate-dependent) n=1 Tax=Puccinia striiformis TaxID=27350 RepID=A0A2S4USX2_9BASI|nr:hypothetical protein PSHT_13061 [Puccinia striiformis]